MAELVPQATFDTDDGDKAIEIPLLPTQPHGTKKGKILSFPRKSSNWFDGANPRYGHIKQLSVSDNFRGGSIRNISQFDHFPTVLLISGGVAVTFTMSHLLVLAEKKARNPAMKVQQLHHVWVVRQQEDISWISEELDRITQLSLPPGFLPMSFYISQGMADIYPHNSRAETGKRDL